MDSLQQQKKSEKPAEWWRENSQKDSENQWTHTRGENRRLLNRARGYMYRKEKNGYRKYVS